MDRESRNGASSSRAVKKKKGWTAMFPVPAHLVESYGGVLPSKVTFRTNESEKKWKLKIEKFTDRYFFTDGWEEFEKEMDIESRGLLMYRAAASSEQKGKNKEKRRKVSGTGNAHGTTDSSLNENKGSDVEKRLNFCKEMKKHHRHRLYIPIDFAKRTGIVERDQIRLKNSEGREWPVLVTTNRDNQFYLCGGLFDFFKGNNIVVGSTLSFRLSSRYTFDVRIDKEGNDKEALFEHMRYRGCEREHSEYYNDSDEKAKDVDVHVERVGLSQPSTSRQPKASPHVIKSSKMKMKAKIVNKPHVYEGRNVYTPKVDVQKVEFHTNLSFNSKEDVINAIKKYAVGWKKDITLTISKADKVQAKCRNKACPWFIYVSRTKHDDIWIVRTLGDEHDCPMPKKVSMATPAWLNEVHGDEIRSHPSCSAVDLRVSLQAKYDIEFSYAQMHSLKHLALSSSPEQYRRKHSASKSMKRKATQIEADDLDRELHEESAMFDTYEEPQIPTRSQRNGGSQKEKEVLVANIRADNVETQPMKRDPRKGKSPMVEPSKPAIDDTELLKRLISNRKRPFTIGPCFRKDGANQVQSSKPAFDASDYAEVHTSSGPNVETWSEEIDLVIIE